MVDKATKRQGWSRLLLLFVLSALVWNAQRIAGAGVEVQAGQGVTDAWGETPNLQTQSERDLGPEYGVGFISSAEDPADDEKYANARATGATWNRWPLYWFNVERSAGEFDWQEPDRTIRADLEQGLQVNVILLGTPWHYRSGAADIGSQAVARPTGRVALYGTETDAPPGLFAPVFTDGDIPGQDKQINDQNTWARFVYRAVNRYRPGGELAQTVPGWPQSGVTIWEIWNEPDLPDFWNGSEEEYARLLKVGYLAAKHADPEARVMVGGLAYFQEDGFFENVLQVFDVDPMAPAYNYFHDMVGVHNYFNAWSSWWYVYRTRLALDARGLEKEIWLNESGVPAWDDYPGPVWDETSPLRATMAKQADFVVQSAFYATFAGADAIFHFQLYDGCGNQPHGTDFPPHNGELCEADGTLPGDSTLPCAGDAFGLFRNPEDAACFTQHPQPETPRPAYAAFKAVTTYLQDVEPLWRLRPGGTTIYNGPQEWIALYRPGTGERVLGLWSRFGADETAVVPALSDRATLVTAQGGVATVTPSDGGTYTLNLPGANYQYDLERNPVHAIGGQAFILVEKDEQPPVGTLSVAPFIEGGELEVEWSADDGLGGGVQDYTLTVAVNGGSRAPWLVETTATSATFPAKVGQTYTFYMVARDRAGNFSAQEEVTVAVQLQSTTIRLPLIFK